MNCHMTTAPDSFENAYSFFQKIVTFVVGFALLSLIRDVTIVETLVNVNDNVNVNVKAIVVDGLRTIISAIGL